MPDLKTLTNTSLEEILATGEEELHRIDWNRKRREGKLEPINCMRCRKSFIQKRHWQKFCSPNCRTRWFLEGEEEKTQILYKESAKLLAERLGITKETK